jgi:hypothetical protein
MREPRCPLRAIVFADDLRCRLRPDNRRSSSASMVWSSNDVAHGVPACAGWAYATTDSLTPETSSAILWRMSARPTRSWESSISSAVNQPLTE